MKTKLLFIVSAFYFAVPVNAQKPFEEIGKANEVEVLTLSNGRYVEHFTYDTLRQIGSVMFNTRTNRIEYFITEEDTAEQKVVERADEVSRFMSVDPLAHRSPDKSPYNFVSNNPISRVDPDGRWDIEVHVYRNREKYGYGIAIVKDRNGNEVYRFRVRVEGAGGRDRMKRNSDTPLGTYDIPDEKMWISGGDRGAYGPNPRLVLVGESGEIEESGRDLIRIHGGRQEIQNEKGEWVPVENPVLKKTRGCIRCYDDDIKTLKEITDQLEENDPEEFGGKLYVVDDLIEDDEGNFVIPSEGEENNSNSEDEDNSNSGTDKK